MSAAAAGERELLPVAIAAARAASALLRDARPHDVRDKGANPRDLITEWDLRSEEAIASSLRAAAPGIPMLGEEMAASDVAHGEDGGAGLRWVVDPIDGTVNFAHGLPIWSVSIALERDRRPVIGVVAAPALGWWFQAVAGAGASDGAGASLRVTTTAPLQRALLSTGFPYDRATSPDNNFAEWEHLQRTAGACRRLGSASLDLCLVARGWIDGYWERKLKPWDVSAGALIVAEAGGTVTNTRGGPFDPYEHEVVASNGAIHTELVAALAHVRRARNPEPTR